MKTVSVIKGNVVTPLNVIYGGVVIVVDGVIDSVASSTILPLDEHLRQRYGTTEVEVVEGEFILPGFVDIHNHGLGGTDDVIGHWSNPDYSLRELACCGTLTTLASIIFSHDHRDLVRRCIDEVEKRVGVYTPDCCVLGGIHAEGPVIHDRGGLPVCESRWPLERFKELCASMPSMRVMTISPHLDAVNNYELIKHLLRIGVRPSLGHDKVATKNEILGALKLAASEDEKLHVTHVHNVMKFHHRDASLLNVALCSLFPNAEIYRGATPPSVEIIADLIHVDAISVQATISSRGCDNVAVITDCISVNRPGKRLSYNGRQSTVRAEGGCYLCDPHGKASKTLAGGTSSMADLFMNLITLFNADLVSACKMVATTPARIARLHDVGAIKPGKKANLLILNAELDTITRRMIHGNWTSHGASRLLKPCVSHIIDRATRGKKRIAERQAGNKRKQRQQQEVFSSHRLQSLYKAGIMGCNNTTERDSNEFARLARENSVAAKLKEEWSKYVRSIARAPSETKVDVWANKAGGPLTHRSVDNVGKLFLVHVRNDLTNHGWAGNFDYSVVGVDGQGYIKASVDVDPEPGNGRSRRTKWEAKVHYLSVKGQ